MTRVYYFDNIRKFIRFPRFLMEDELKEISAGGKLLYMFIANSATMSEKNGFTDSQKRVVVYFDIQRIADMLSCTEEEAENYLFELESFRLIEVEDNGKHGYRIIPLTVI